MRLQHAMCDEDNKIVKLWNLNYLQHSNAHNDITERKMLF